MSPVAYGLAFPATRGVLGAPFPAPLEQVSGVTVTGAWGIARPLFARFSGQNRFRVRDTVTAGEQDCASPGAANAFLGADSGAVVRLYDQSGNGHTLSNAAAAQQPVFATAIGANSRAGCVFDNADDYLAGAACNQFYTADAGYFVGVFQVPSPAAAHGAVYQDNNLFGDMGGGGWFGAIASSRIATTAYDGAFKSAILSNPGAGLFAFEAWRDAGTLYAAVNGAAPASASCGSLVSSYLSGAFAIGKAYVAATAMNGSFLELAVMSGRPSQAGQIVANMKTYYGIS